MFLPIRCGYKSRDLGVLHNKSGFQVRRPQCGDFVSKHKRGEFSLFFSCFGKEEREYMAGCVLQAGISGGKIGATAGQGERMPCHVPCKEIRLRLQPGLSEN